MDFTAGMVGPTALSSIFPFKFRNFWLYIRVRQNRDKRDRKKEA